MHRAIMAASLLLAVTSASWASLPQPPTMEFNVEHCPRCEDMFSKLEAADGGLEQDVEMQERGEPKSGTTMMTYWAINAIRGTCNYLKLIYGNETCNTSTVLGHRNTEDAISMIFNPQMASDNRACKCDIRRVSISFTAALKHTLPVKEACPWSHSRNVPRGGEACRTGHGSNVTNLMELTSCVEAAACEITDTRLQVVPVRDPRAETVSLYFELKAHAPRLLGNATTLDQFVMSTLAEVCQWVALRHMIFGGLLAGRSHLFWYEDAIVDPVRWHFDFTAFAGLQLPSTVVEGMAKASSDSSSSLVNIHEGGRPASDKRTWRDEVGREVLDSVDDVLRVWLPGVILARLGLL